VLTYHDPIVEELRLNGNISRDARLVLAVKDRIPA
jgi:hypothetical protein